LSDTPFAKARVAWICRNQLAELFVLRRYRKAGIGRAAVQIVLDKHLGRWEVGQRRENEPAREFWRSVIAGYTRGNYVELDFENDEFNGTVQIFDTGDHKVSALKTESFLRERAARGKNTAFDSGLEASPDVPPDTGDGI
jgi:hypothetical protein